MGKTAETEVNFTSPQVQSDGQTYAPKWNHPKCGARFGFGGKLVTFNGQCLKIHTQVTHSKELGIASQVQDLDSNLTKAMSSGTLP